MTGSAFVISLDFELLWGVRDHATRESYGANVLGAREAVPQMLALFERYGVAATWATVGFLFCEDRDDLMAHLPAPEDRPGYAEQGLSNYSYLDEVGRDETDDPYYFASSLIERIIQTPGQELSTHTMSHYYCLEAGQTPEQFRADLQAAARLAARRNVELKTIVFPRNQYSEMHLEICRQEGLTGYRGNAPGWAYKPGAGTEQTKARRALRLVDAYSGALGDMSFALSAGQETLRDIPASRFLRPCAGRLAPLHGAHVATIKREMRSAAKAGRGYHLWWHPHNFGINLEANMAGLETILKEYQRLNATQGMQSRSMAELT